MYKGLCLCLCLYEKVPITNILLVNLTFSLINYSPKGTLACKVSRIQEIT